MNKTTDLCAALPAFCDGFPSREGQLLKQRKSDYEKDGAANCFLSDETATRKRTLDMHTVA